MLTLQCTDTGTNTWNIYICVYTYNVKNLSVAYHIPSSQKGELSVPCLKPVLTIVFNLGEILQIVLYA